MLRSARALGLLASCVTLTVVLSHTALARAHSTKIDPALVEVVTAVLQSVPIDSLCQPVRCSVVVVDSAIRSARDTQDLDVFRLPVVAYISPRTLPSPPRAGVRFLLGTLRHGRPAADTAWVALAITPASLSGQDSAAVSMTVAIPGELGVFAVARVGRQGRTWVVRGVSYYPG